MIRFALLFCFCCLVVFGFFLFCFFLFLFLFLLLLEVFQEGSWVVSLTSESAVQGIKDVLRASHVKYINKIKVKFYVDREGGSEGGRREGEAECHDTSPRLCNNSTTWSGLISLFILHIWRRDESMLSGFLKYLRPRLLRFS